MSDYNTFLLENTIYHNQAAVSGGSIYIQGVSGGKASVVLKNNIISETLMGEGCACSDSASPQIRFNDFWDNLYGDFGLLGNTECRGATFNHFFEPKWNLPEWHDFRLLKDSPCIDAGDSLYLDPDGTISDLGAFFFNQNLPVSAYVSSDRWRLLKGRDYLFGLTLINTLSNKTFVEIEAKLVIPNGTVKELFERELFINPSGSKGYSLQKKLKVNIPESLAEGIYNLILSVNGNAQDTLSYYIEH